MNFVSSGPGFVSLFLSRSITARIEGLSFVSKRWRFSSSGESGLDGVIASAITVTVIGAFGGDGLVEARLPPPPALRAPPPTLPLPPPPTPAPLPAPMPPPVPLRRAFDLLSDLVTTFAV